MFMASSSQSSGSYNAHVNPDDSVKNIDVCIGGYSGSDSNYAMHKSNCFDLMVSTCSVQWSDKCDLYVSQCNPQQASLFQQAVKPPSVPLSSRNTCRLTTPSHIPTQRIVMGMNSFVTEDNTTVPTSCYQSTFLEHKKKEWLKQLEYEQRQLQRKSIQRTTTLYTAPQTIKRHIDIREVIFSPSASPNSASPNSASPNSVSPNSVSPNSVSPNSVSPNSVSPNSVSPNSVSPNSVSPNSASPNSVSPDSVSPNSVSPDSVSPNSVSPNSVSPNSVLSKSSSPASSPVGLSSLLESSTVSSNESQTDFYSTITNVTTTSCNKTCDISKFA